MPGLMAKSVWGPGKLLLTDKFGLDYRAKTHTAGLIILDGNCIL